MAHVNQPEQNKKIQIMLAELTKQLQKLQPNLAENPEDDLIALNEVASMLNVSPRTIRNKCNKGIIRKFKIGRTSLIHISDIRKIHNGCNWLDENDTDDVTLVMHDGILMGLDTIVKIYNIEPDQMIRLKEDANWLFPFIYNGIEFYRQTDIDAIYKLEILGELPEDNGLES